MTRLLTATCAVALLTSPVHAGGMAEPIEMAPVEIVEDTAGSAGSSGGLIVPLIIIALIAAAASSSSSDSGDSLPLSDIRAKTNIVPVGETPSGLGLYEFSYVGQSDRYVGVMAQEVLHHSPEAVVVHPSGLLTVDYDRIDAEMIKLN